MLTQSCSWFPVGEYELGVPVLGPPPGVESKLPEKFRDRKTMRQRKNVSVNNSWRNETEGNRRRSRG
jgi:hypothetical protein